MRSFSLLYVASFLISTAMTDTAAPTASPTIANATAAPTAPSNSTNTTTSAPTAAPTSNTTNTTTSAPTAAPTSNATNTTTAAPTAVPTQAPTNDTTTPAPTNSPTQAPTTQKHTYHPTHGDGGGDSHDDGDKKEHHLSFFRILGKLIAWLCLIFLAVVAFGGIMNHRYRIFYFMRGVWYTILSWECTNWLVERLGGRGRARASRPDATDYTVLFDNEMSAGLLLRENE